mmetsp:Transcript_15688/g.24366  ORF Transcript_15688/g.24366 Transcript_15688/m.24366 type:complete len:80 (-) Transcript_15688:201-440(-)
MDNTFQNCTVLGPIGLACNGLGFNVGSGRVAVPWHGFRMDALRGLGRGTAELPPLTRFASGRGSSLQNMPLHEPGCFNV